MLASSTTWSHLHARSPRVFHEFRIAGVRPPELSIFATTPPGIDVAKAKLASGKPTTKVVAKSRAGLTDPLGWLDKQHAETTRVHVALEGIGIHHESAASRLHDAGLAVSVVNPAQVCAFATGMGVRTKIDIVGSHVPACSSIHAQPMRWSPPASEARILQALMARREALAPVTAIVRCREGRPGLRD